MAKLFAARLALIAFAVTLADALFSSRAFYPSLSSALIKAVLFYGIGFVVGELARRIIEENAEAEFKLSDEVAGQSAADV